MRIGRFAISGEMFAIIKSEIEFTGTHDLMRFMSQILITRAEYRPTGDGIEYTGISSLFDNVKEGHRIPWYTIEYQVVEGVTLCKAFKRADPQDLAF